MIDEIDIKVKVNNRREGIVIETVLNANRNT